MTVISCSRDPVNDSTKSPCINTGDPASPLDPDNTRADIGTLYFNQGTGVEENQEAGCFYNQSEIYLSCQHHPLEIYLPDQMEYPFNISIFNISGQLIKEEIFNNVVQNILIVDLKKIFIRDIYFTYI